MKKILVPIDFSTTSYAAAEAGAAIARKLRLEVFLLHVVRAPSDWNRMSVIMQQKFPEVESQMVDANIAIDKLAGEPMFEGMEVSPMVQTGVPCESIVEAITTHNIDLVVIGAHGAGETDTLFVGSTAQRVIRLSPCPVISVKRNHDLSQIKQILFVSDFEEDISEALDKTSELAEAFDAKLELVYINTPAQFKDTVPVEMTMEHVLAEHSKVKSSATIYNYHERDKGILSYMDRINPQLVAIVTHGRKSKPLYLISVTDTLLFHAEVPVLSFVLKH